ncbi:HEPN domain-containing protein [Fulvivirga kasyanovii]|uniref:HEPN domain-containing protein n=1 Tax=Fulvivirga kasyanovii TaxID=396812 RepID=A0ABW9RSH9_9BACT|nr:HEPN domain-containing protein [Fulvivirga kasyanovii]MTI26269.1 HEPN domain-containing protein [Fulvivirga kasyanovii]
MSNTVENIPENKREELKKLTELISGMDKVEMLILFGSYAKGDWVEDSYVENDTIYEYRSDFDLLVVLRHENFSFKVKIEEQVKSQLIETGEVTTPVSMIFHGINHFNQALSIGSYFFKDIKEEGIVLYDSGKHKLTSPKRLTAKQYQEKAQEYYDQWFESANNAWRKYKFSVSEEILNEAAFDLHQAVERYYTTILLVFTDYRPKDHNLETLGIKVEMCDKRFDVFPKSTNESKRLFELLKRAYIDARYKMKEYHITKSDLEYLAARVEELKQLTEEICLEKIAQIGERK